MIACVWTPHFDTELQRSTDKKLAGKPVLLCDPDTTAVAARCRTAAERGVMLDMPLHAALAAVPDAVILSYSPQHVTEAHNALLECLRDFTDRIEPMRDGDSLLFYLDLGRLKQKQIATLGRKIIRGVKREIGLSAHVGIASNRFTAFAAAYIEDGLRMIPMGSEAGFLFLRPVDWLPLNGEHLRRLRLFGIETMGAFAKLPRYAVQAQFGKEALLAHALASGMDQRPVKPHIPRQKETGVCLFDDPVESLPNLHHALYHHVAPVFSQLGRVGYHVETLAVIFQLDDGSTIEHTRRMRVHRPDALARSLGAMLAGLSFSNGVVAFETTLTAALLPTPVQMNLFPDEVHLAHSLRLVAEQVGGENIEEAVQTRTDAPLPEDRFTIRRLA